MKERAMGREVRRVPADWQHPTDGIYANGEIRYRALFDGIDYASRVREWDEDAAKWARGEFPDYASEESRKMTYAEYSGERPDAADYMPQWADAERTHLMMYETTSEGTPISPAFATPEELARWLADNNASAFGSDTASYEGWLRVARGGYACSAVYSDKTGLMSGVDGLTA
jgi:hypothetical protein